MDYAGFEFLTGITCRETLAFKTGKRRRQRRKQTNQFVRIGVD